MTSRFKIQDAYSKGLKAAAKLPRRVQESPSVYRSEIDAVVRAFRDKEDDKHQTLLGSDWADSWIRGDYGQDYRWGLETALGWGPYRYAVYEYRGDGVYKSPVSPLYDNPTEARRWIQKNLSRDDAYHGGSQGRGYVVRQTAKENPTHRIRNGALEFRTRSHRDQVAQLLRRHPQGFGSRVFEQDSRSKSAGRSKKSPAYLIVAPGVGQDELSRWWQRAVEADHGRGKKTNPDRPGTDAESRLWKQFQTAFPNSRPYSTYADLSQTIADMDGVPVRLAHLAEALQYGAHGGVKQDPVKGLKDALKDKEPPYRGGGPSPTAKRAQQILRLLGVDARL